MPAKRFHKAISIHHQKHFCKESESKTFFVRIWSPIKQSLRMLEAHMLLDGTMEGTIYERITLAFNIINNNKHVCVLYWDVQIILGNHLDNLGLKDLFNEHVICSLRHRIRLHTIVRCTFFFSFFEG